MSTIAQHPEDTDRVEVESRPGPSLGLQRGLAMALLIAQGGITVTGAIVRVTGSGLGCDTWPACNENSLVPVAGVAPAIHQAIEFGNRLLAIVLSLLALAVIVVVFWARRRTGIKVMAILSLAGVVLQAVIGGMSVLLNLRWWAVALHFLPSMALVAIAAVLYMRLAEPDDAPVQLRFAPSVRVVLTIVAVALAIVLFTGTMVTGSGPHAGDAGVGMEGRLQLDTEILAYVHAACMYIFLAGIIGSVYLMYRTDAPKDALNTAFVLISIIMVQWAVGVTQFHLGVPRWTVPVHIGLAATLVAFTSFLLAHGKRRVP